MKLLQQCFLFYIVVVIPGHNLGYSQVSVNRTIGPTLVSSSVEDNIEIRFQSIILIQTQSPQLIFVHDMFIFSLHSP